MASYIHPLAISTRLSIDLGQSLGEEMVRNTNYPLTFNLNTYNPLKSQVWSLETVLYFIILHL